MIESARAIAEKLTQEGYLGPLVKAIERSFRVEGFSKSLDTNPDVFAFKDMVRGNNGRYMCAQHYCNVRFDRREPAAWPNTKYSKYIV